MRSKLGIAVAASMVLLSACTLPTPRASVPDKVEILYPRDGSTVLFGDTINIRALASDSQGIAWVQLWVDDAPASDLVTPDAPVTYMEQDIPWSPNVSGPHRVKVIAQSNAGEQIESDIITLHVSADASLRATSVAVLLKTPTRDPFAIDTPLPTLFPTPAPSATSTPTPTFTPTPTPTATPVSCVDGAAFVVDVTVPDGTVFNKGDTFDKTWQLRNTGTCDWDNRYEFVFVDGEQMDGASPTALRENVPPGETVDVTVPMVAPGGYGTHRGRWQMRNPDGTNFGSVVDVLIEVKPGPDDPPLIERFEVIPNSIGQGQSATIYWKYVNGTFARLIPGGEGGVGASGSLNVSPNTTTSYRLVVSNGVGTVERSITLFVQPTPTPTPKPAPAAPTGLEITDIDPNGFKFAWTDNSSNEEGFRLYNADTQGVVITFPADTVGGDVTGLNCETSYRFYLVAFNQSGESFASNTVQEFTSECTE